MSDTAKVLHATPLEEVIRQFNERRDVLMACCAKTKILLEECLQDADIRYQSVQARVKTVKKLREKYSNPDKRYTRLNDITDLIGLRIITYYGDDVDLVAEVVKREFEIDTANTVDKRNQRPDRFGYHALNFVCRHLDKRLSSPEYRKFAGLSCEIQISSILSHAWAEIEHEWYDMRATYPDDIKRRFSRMAALLEVAESEFLEIRKKRSNFQRSVALQVEAKVSGVALEPMSIKSFIDHDPIVARLDAQISAVLNAPISLHLGEHALQIEALAATAAELRTVEELRAALGLHEAAIVEFVKHCRPFRPRNAASDLSRGISISELSIMLVAAKGEEPLAKILQQLKMSVDVNLNALARSAAKVIAKHGRKAL